MLKWKNVTDSFSERQRWWKGLYLEICEVSSDPDEKIECDLWSNENGDWEIFFTYGIMDGVSYASADKAEQQREQMKKDIEDEYSRHQNNPSRDFINEFGQKYNVDILHAYF